MSPTGSKAVRTRVFVLEEHPLLREGVITYLGLQPDLVVCGETDNIRDARNKIATCKPHLLISIGNDKLKTPMLALSKCALVSIQVRLQLLVLRLRAEIFLSLGMPSMLPLDSNR